MKFVEKLKAIFAITAQPEQKQVSAFTYKAPAPTSSEGWDPVKTPLRNSVDYRDYPMAG